MTKVEIYTSALCGYCYAAKALLNKKKIPFDEIDVTLNPKLRAEMQKRANGGYTVPQIFINGESIGGSDDLHALERAGKLDSLLEPA